MPRFLGCLAIVLCLPAASVRAELAVSTNFEGGSAKVVAIDQRAKTIRIMPGGDPAQGWPCWWYLRIDGATAEDAITLEVVASDAKMPPRGNSPARLLPASWCQPSRAHYSSDGQIWTQTERSPPAKDGVRTYQIPGASGPLWLAWGPPFTPRDSAELVKSLAAGHEWAEATELCRSNGGRPCPMLRLKQGEQADAKRLAIWLQARQHAWESGGSWVCRGAAEWLAGDDPRAAALREKCEIVIVPIMDIDNTLAGNGGKDAVPRDHNRDWTDEPFHAEVAAAQQALAKFSEENRLALFVDLHNPAPDDGLPFFFVSPEDLLTDAGRRNLDRFLTISRGEINGPLPLSDKTRSSGPGYDPLWKQISKNWVSVHAPPFAVSVTLETAWSNAHSHAEGYRTVGRQLAQAIEKYLRDDPRK
ncbi:MAG: M14-type cytosolic carboxypeptidase [Pirellulaceae bacterium]|nr:M14-type cytosolic carboxypeptidase [Pirellulaceae bacterium]